MSVKIVQLERHYLPTVAAIHSKAFPESALTQLGLEAVRRYYEWQLAGPHDHHFIGSIASTGLTGFAVGGVARAALAGFVQKNLWFLVFRILLAPRVVFDARGRKAMITALQVLRRLRVQARTSVQSPPKALSFGILAIAVDPVCQSKGIGLMLMEHFEHIAREKGYRRMHLTVSTSNVQAIRFYEKLGWTKCLTNGQWSGGMEKLLHD